MSLDDSFFNKNNYLHRVRLFHRYPETASDRQKRLPCVLRLSCIFVKHTDKKQFIDNLSVNYVHCMTNMSMILSIFIYCTATNTAWDRRPIKEGQATMCMNTWTGTYIDKITTRYQYKANNMPTLSTSSATTYRSQL